MRSVSDIAARLKSLRESYQERDQRHSTVTSIRHGKWADVAPELFPTDFPKPLVANFIDVAARDFAASSSDLPAFICSSVSMVSDRARAFSDKRTRIANHYVASSDLAGQMVTGADQFFTYGSFVIYVEADWDTKTPKIVVEDPMGGYPEFDRAGKCTAYYKVWSKTIDDLCMDYPEFEGAIRGRDQVWSATSGTSRLDLVRFCDEDQITLFLPQRKNVVLKTVAHKLGRCPAVVKTRPGVKAHDSFGQFDDVVWPSLARNKFALLGLDAAEKSVNAPLQLPRDVDELALGPDTVIHTDGQVSRVKLEIPQSVFAEMANLNAEIRVGAGYPEGRSGNIDASVVTGQGMQELLAGFSQQIKNAQSIFSVAFKDTIGLCFAMDEAYWPDVSKTVRGDVEGVPYEITYIPSRDIKGDLSVDIQYGMLGLDKNRALIFILQCQSAGLISLDTARRFLPISIASTEEAQRLDVEKMRTSLLEAVAALGQAIPAMTQQGQDPTKLVQGLALVIKARQAGKSVEDAVAEALAPEPEPDAADPSEASEPGEASQPPGPATPGGPLAETAGAMPAPQSPQDSVMSTMMAGLSPTGAPQLGGGVSRRSITPG